MASPGPGHQLRYDSADLSLVSESGGRSSISTMPRTPRRTARWYAAAMPAMPAPQMTTSAVLTLIERRFYRTGWIVSSPVARRVMV